jgi:HK97 family phage prohead protease
MSLEWGYSLLRSYALEDIEIQRGGDGRTVTAYAAMFGQPYEVRDQHGHYMEEIERSAFNRTLSHGSALRSAVCLYNHGYTAAGTPDMLGSVPLGTPLDIRAEDRGLLTVTRYNRSALADATLEAIHNGDVKSMSFRGQIHRSSPARVPRTRAGQPLPTVTRHELGLSDYGPTPFAVNQSAEIVAVRSLANLATNLQHLDADGRAELMRMLASTPPDEDPDDDNATPSEGPGAEDPPNEALRSADIARRIRVEQILRGMK